VALVSLACPISSDASKSPRLTNRCRAQIAADLNRCCHHFAVDSKSLLPPDRRCCKIAAAPKSPLPQDRRCCQITAAPKSRLPLFCRGCHIAPILPRLLYRCNLQLELAEAAKSPNRQIAGVPKSPMLKRFSKSPRSPNRLSCQIAKGCQIAAVPK